jgi:hypothetical protein
MVEESWLRNGLEIWPTRQAAHSNLERAHFSATKSWPKIGLKIQTTFLHENTLSHELALGLGHPTDVRPPAGSSDPTAQHTLTTRASRRKTAKVDSDKQIAGQSYRTC